MTTSGDELQRSIEREFPAHVLNADLAFRDWGGTYLDAQDFKSGVRGKTWLSLDDKFLEFHHDALYAVGPAFFPQYIPACLAALLRGSNTLDALPGFVAGVLTQRPDRADPEMRFEARLQSLTNGQKQVIAEVLQYIARTASDSARRRTFSEALDSHWRSHLTQTGR